jgi:glycosyltransferase involved in cell wall biosynthesis
MKGLMGPRRLAILTSHPVQYYGPLFRETAKHLDLHVFFAHRATPGEQARAGFGTAFEWDVDITSGYAHSFLENVARRPGADHFFGCDTPEIGHCFRAGDFDGLLMTGWHLKTYMQGLLAAKRLGMDVIVRSDSQLATPRSYLKNAFKALAYPAFLKMFDAALYVGQRSRSYFESFSYPSERLFYSPHCVDTEWFAARATANARQNLRCKYGIASAVKVVLFAGKLIAFKRPLDLIGAASICRARGLSIEIMVAGDGPLRSELTAAASAAQVPLHLLGFCNQTEMPAAYAASDCLVLPSSGEETWGLVANEALACGRPVILSHLCGCAPDLAYDGRVGRIFTAGDLADLADAIENVMTAPCSPGTLAEVSNQFSLSAAADGIQQAMESCSARKRASTLGS